MIKANELRIGNWILKDGHYPLRAVAIGQTKKKNALVSTSEFIDIEDDPNLQPIPLTPEILEACGSLSPYVISKYGKEYYSLFFDSVAACNVVGEVELKSLHQLQNLYFALTGEELMISETALKRSVATTAK